MSAVLKFIDSTTERVRGVPHPDEVARICFSSRECPHGCNVGRTLDQRHCFMNPYVDHIWPVILTEHNCDWRTEESDNALRSVKKSFLSRSERFNETVTEIENQFVRRIVPYRSETSGMVKLSGQTLVVGAVRSIGCTVRGISGFCGRISGYL